MRRLAVTAIALHVIASFLLVSVMRQSPLRRRRPIPGRTAADLDAERRRLARQRAAIEGHHEPDHPRIPYADLTPATDALDREPRRSGVAAVAAVVGRLVAAARPLRVRSLTAPPKTLRRRSRIAVPLGLGFLALVMASTSFAPYVEPTPITARPPTIYTPLPVTAIATSITVDHEPDRPLVIEFSSPMNRADVEGRLVIEPAAEIRLAWSADDRLLTVAPATSWARGTYYTITIPAGALDQQGAALAAPVRAAFLVRGLTAARISAPRSSGGLARLDTSFVVSFDRPVDLAAAAGAFTVAPPLRGTFSPASGAGQQLAFMPAEPLTPDTAYTVTLADGLVDDAGSPLAPTPPVTIRTVPHPRVRSTSPMADATGVASTTRITVRFSRPMDPATTPAAFSVNVAGRTLAGVTSLSDGGSLLTFQPSSALPLGARVGVRVGAEASSVDGVPMLAGVSFAFTVRTALDASEPAPAAAVSAGKPADAADLAHAERRLHAATQAARDKAAKVAKEKAAAARAAAEKKKAAAARAAAEKKDAAAKAAAKAAAEKKKAAAAAKKKADAEERKTAAKKPATRAIPKPSSGGSSWVAVEAYYLELVNCTRTGGWVQKNGSCTGAGSRKGVKPLKLDAGISAKVARPYAKKLALAGACSHFSGSSPAARLRNAGYRSHKWAENLSCPPGMTPQQTAVYSIRYFQNEKPYNGGHYRNLMNPAYDRVGIGIWAARGRVIIVSDFYRP